MNALHPDDPGFQPLVSKNTFNCDKLQANIWCIIFRSKNSSNTVLCLIRNLMHQTLARYVFKSVNFSSHFFATWNFANVKTLLNIILYIWGFGRETVEEYKKKFFKLTKRTEIFTSFNTIIKNFSIRGFTLDYFTKPRPNCWPIFQFVLRDIYKNKT